MTRFQTNTKKSCSLFQNTIRITFHSYNHSPKMTIISEEYHKEDWMEVDDKEDLYVYKDNNRFFVLVNSFLLLSQHMLLWRKTNSTIHTEHVPLALILSRLGERFCWTNQIPTGTVVVVDTVLQL